MIQELWSCGQTGVARGALWAAKQCSLSCAGWIAQNFMTESGPAPEVAALFGLKELERPGELMPIRQNVKECDSSVWISAPPRAAQDRAFWVTRKAVATYGHPFLCISSKMKVAEAAQNIAAWARRWDVKRLHVAGPKASIWPEGEDRARQIITAALHELGACCPRPRVLKLVS